MFKDYYKNAKRFYNTVKYLKIKQIAWRFWYKFYKAEKVDSHNLNAEVILNAWVKHAERQPSLINAQTFIFLGETGNIDEIGWDGPERSKLWRYNQHYFDDLNAENHRPNIMHNSPIARWTAKMPFGFGSGWEPYPTSENC